jgi:hypothetical protein
VHRAAAKLDAEAGARILTGDLVWPDPDSKED